MQAMTGDLRRISVVLFEGFELRAGALGRGSS
jgi:hypothetical protein